MSVPRYWREIPQRYNLQAARCTVCRTTYFPPRAVCPDCRRESVGKMERVRLAGRGTIVEWTRIHRPAPGYEHQVPYTVALIATDDGPRVMGHVVETEGRSLERGMRVKAVFRRLGQDGEAGVIHYGTKWRLAETQETLPLLDEEE